MATISVPHRKRLAPTTSLRGSWTQALWRVRAAYAKGGGLILDEAAALCAVRIPVFPGESGGQCLVRNLWIAIGAITSVSAADQPTVTHTSCATGPPIIRPRAESASEDSGL